MKNWHIQQAVRVIKNGGVIAYPTEAVWGLGCDPGNWQAVDRLLALKKRNIEKGLILVAANINQFESYLTGLPDDLYQKLNSSWPGPITWLVPDLCYAPYWIKGKHASIALRVTDHPLVQQLCDDFSGPIVSTSANIASRMPAKSLLAVKKNFGSDLDYILPGKLGFLSKPTMIKDLTTDRIIRQ